jgi:hypothetical protein
MEKDKAHNIEEILTFLRGGEEIDIVTIAQENPEIFARCIAYLLKQRYHRRRMIKAVVTLLNKSPPAYREIAWQLIQMIPLSFFLELFKAIYKKDNTKRLRHALTNKLAKERRLQIIRTFLLGPDAYRKLFSRLYLPREEFNDKEIKNQNYKLAYQLSTLSIPQAIEELKIKKGDLIKKFKLQFEQIINLIDNKEEAVEIVKILDSKSFFHHIRWFREMVGDELYEKTALEKLEHLTNPQEFLLNREHLEETGALTEDITKYLEKRSKKIFEDMMKKFKLDYLALIVDVSGSMQVAVDLTQKLYEAFSQMGNITDIIAFNNVAFSITAERLRTLKADGGTSIGASIVSLRQRLDERKGLDKPQAIILVTDLDENVPPMLNPSLKLLEDYDNPPLIVIHCGKYRRDLKIQYPNAKLRVNDFHKGLIMQIMENIARITSKVAVKEKVITKVLGERKPLEEEIGSIDLPERPKESLQKGYLESILCQEIKEKEPDSLTIDEFERII